MPQKYVHQMIIRFNGWRELTALQVAQAVAALNWLRLRLCRLISSELSKDFLGIIIE